VIVEHRFYGGSRAPHRFITDDPDDLEDYVRNRTKPGDSLWFWRFDECCTEERAFKNGKRPDDAGKVPKGGAY